MFHLRNSKSTSNSCVNKKTCQDRNTQRENGYVYMRVMEELLNYSPGTVREIIRNAWRQLILLF